MAEPRPVDPPAPGTRDRVLVGILALCAVLEALLRDDLPAPLVSVLVTAGLAPLLLWRRSRPLEVAVAVFGTVTAVDVVLLLVEGTVIEQTTLVYVLLVPYALVRWGSGREAVLGLGVVMVPATLSAIADWNGPAEAIGGFGVLAAIVALGFAVRTQGQARGRRLEQARAEERVQLARELHDTVAHHVSAIAVQAQAGRALATSDPAAPLQALAVIEVEASRTLAEMRSIVRVLRAAEPAESVEMAPQSGVADLVRLSDVTAGGPPVDVRVATDVGDLPPAVDAAVYRIAQEAVTNARRHARNATRIEVRLAGDRAAVSLDVCDDGEPVAPVATAGFGLTGMAERAALLGGECTAGPRADRGWAVRARLPRQVPA